MSDLISHKTFENNNFQVLTDKGFKDFKGIIVGENENKIEIKISNGYTLVCTPKHKIFINDETYKDVEDLKIGDIIFNNLEILNISYYKNDDLMYDLLEVDDVHRYYINGILSKNCLLLDELAWIEPDSMVQDFMSSVLPTISRAKTSKILITSTPRGKDNVFYKMYNAATKEGTDAWNEFHAETVHWSEIPDRDEAWKRKEIARLGSYEIFAQEYECAFLDNTQGSIDEELFDKMKEECKEPLHILKDGKYKIWEEYDPEKIYVIGGDVSEGVGLDSSVLEIFDITNPAEIIQVAEYHNNEIGPSEFTNEINEICLHWGQPLLLIERNNQGTGVCDRMANEFAYPNLVSWGAKESHKNKQNGMISHINTKYKAVLNMRYFVNEMKSVKFRSLDTLKELKNFIRYPNGSWKAKSGEHDDRVMAMVWGLMGLYNDIAELYFEIQELDDCDRPLKISPIDMGLHKFRSSTSIYTNESVEKIEHSNLLPVSFGHFNAGQQDIADMMEAGWEFPEGSPHYNPSQHISSEQWELLEKYF